MMICTVQGPERRPTPNPLKHRDAVLAFLNSCKEQLGGTPAAGESPPTVSAYHATAAAFNEIKREQDDSMLIPVQALADMGIAGLPPQLAALLGESGDDSPAAFRLVLMAASDESSDSGCDSDDGSQGEEEEGGDLAFPDSDGEDGSIPAHGHTDLGMALAQLGFAPSLHDEAAAASGGAETASGDTAPQADGAREVLAEPDTPIARRTRQQRPLVGSTAEEDESFFSLLSAGGGVRADVSTARTGNARSRARRGRSGAPQPRRRARGTGRAVRTPRNSRTSQVSGSESTSRPDSSRGRRRRRGRQ